MMLDNGDNEKSVEILTDKDISKSQRHQSWRNDRV